MVDRFSKATHFIPLPKLPSARKTATIVLDHVSRIHGLPVDVVSDRGPQFVSKFWTEFCQQLEAIASLSSRYPPQTNSQAERANQDLERVLRCVVSAEPSSWSSRLTMVEYAHNSLPVSSTGLSPFQCCLGYQTPLFSSQESDAVVPSAHSFVQSFLRAWRIAREALTRTGERNKASADRHSTKPPLYVCGQKVWLSSKHINFRLPARKLGPRFIGPFVVAKVLCPVTIRLKLTPQIKPVFRSPLQPLISAPPPPRLIKGSPAYSVRRLIDVRRRGRGYQYLLDWEGYGLEERCWIPAHDILDHALIDQFSVMVMSPLGTPGGVPEVGSTVTVQGAFSAPLVVLSCSAAHGLGNQCPSCSRSAQIMSWFSPTCRSSPLSLICPCVLLLVVSRLFCPCSCYVFWLPSSLSHPLFPCAAGFVARRSGSLCGLQILPAGSGISAS